ncbi:MAG: shikimate kinase, partial [Pyrinomonadaceae bacterium]
TIADLIKNEGEPHFREAETAALRSVLETGPARIIALGGGAWTIERNRQLIDEHDCITIWLDAPFELCWSRIMQDQQLRPLASDPQSTHKLYIERRQYYKLATLRLNATEDKSAENLAVEIINALSLKRLMK